MIWITLVNFQLNKEANYWVAFTIKDAIDRLAFENYCTQRVMEKCDFIKSRKDVVVANAWDIEIEKFSYKLGK